MVANYVESIRLKQLEAMKISATTASFTMPTKHKILHARNSLIRAGLSAAILLVAVASLPGKFVLASIQCHQTDNGTSVADERAAQAKNLTSINVISVNLTETLSSRDSRCASAERELDKCSAQLMGLGLSQGDSVLPGTMVELDSVFCPRFRKVVGCIKGASECYKPFERQIISWILSSTRRMNYKRCQNENEKVRFLRLTQSCFSQMQDHMDKCMGNYIANLDAIADRGEFVAQLTEDDIQIQLSCCANDRFKQCIMSSARQHCRPLESLRKLKRTNSVSSHRSARKLFARSSMDMMDDLKRALDGMALTGPEFICNSVDEKFCQAKFDGRFRGRSLRHKSIVPAMIKIYSNRQ